MDRDPGRNCLGMSEPTEQKPATPFDLFRKKIGRVSKEVAQERLDICKDCPFYTQGLGRCKKCGCFMPEKVKLPNAFCPVHKWETAEAV